MKLNRQYLLEWLCIGCSMLSPLSTFGQTTASGTLDLDSLSASASGASSLSWSGDWSLTVLSSVFSTSGGVGLDFSTGSSSANSSASVLYAMAHSSAVAPGPTPPGLTGHVDGEVSLPGGFEQLATVGDSGNFSSFQTTFRLVGGAAMVSFDAAIASSLNASADPDGMVLRTDAIFNLIVDGTTVLSFSELLTANPGESRSSTQTPSLSGMINLDPGDHNLFIELDTEQQALTVPDDAATAGVLLGALVALGLVMGVKRGSLGSRVNINS